MFVMVSMLKIFSFDYGLGSMQKNHHFEEKEEKSFS